MTWFIGIARGGARHSILKGTLPWHASAPLSEPFPGEVQNGGECSPQSGMALKGRGHLEWDSMQNFMLDTPYCPSTDIILYSCVNWYANMLQNLQACFFLGRKTFLGKQSWTQNIFSSSLNPWMGKKVAFIDHLTALNTELAYHLPGRKMWTVMAAVTGHLSRKIKLRRQN